MKCLCCGKEINDLSLDSEKKNRWHESCVKKFFNSKDLPIMDFSEELLSELAYASVDLGMSVTGVQKKLSLHLSDAPYPRLTVVDYPTGYIFKPQTEEFDSMPELEDLAMRLAQLSGIKTVPYALMEMDGKYAYIVKRVDRRFRKKSVSLFAMEDFCQLSQRLTEDKYKGSYEYCSKIIKDYSKQPGVDISELFLRIVLSFIIGNSDMHLKNFSLIETAPGSRIFILSGAYDMLPVNVIMPEDSEQLALTLNGKKSNIKRNDFTIFAQNCGIPIKAADKMINKLCDMKDAYYTQCDASYVSDELKIKMKTLIAQRIQVLRQL